MRLGDVRLAGLSGIFKAYHYNKGHYERMPYSKDDLRSVYHVRSFEEFQLRQLRGALDIGLSHDWPQRITYHGNQVRTSALRCSAWLTRVLQQALLHKKKFLRDELDTFGSPPAMRLLQHLRPTYWLSGHMHVKFAAVVEHKASDEASAKAAASTQADADADADAEKKDSNAETAAEATQSSSQQPQVCARSATRCGGSQAAQANLLSGIGQGWARQRFSADHGCASQFKRSV